MSRCFVGPLLRAGLLRAGLLLAGLIVVAAPAQTPNSAPAACRTIATDATDGPAASPANHTIVFENADVRVIDVHSQPHTREAVHTHARPAILYFQQQGAGTMNTPENPRGASHPTDPNFKPYFKAVEPQGPHWTENTGEVPFHATRVELKHPGCGLPGWKPAAPGPDDALTTASGDHSLLFENNEVRVLDVRLAPHTRDSMHSEPWPGFFYIVQGASLREFRPGEAEPELRTFPAGVEVVPSAAGQHSLENNSDTPLHLILFELKYGSSPEKK
jgi:hypothetical protein